MRFDVVDAAIQHEPDLFEHLTAGRFLERVDQGCIRVDLSAREAQPSGSEVFTAPALDRQVAAIADHGNLHIHPHHARFHAFWLRIPRGGDALHRLPSVAGAGCGNAECICRK
jgi:hypothetical protein